MCLWIVPRIILICLANTVEEPTGHESRFAYAHRHFASYCQHVLSGEDELCLHVLDELNLLVFVFAADLKNVVLRNRGAVRRFNDSVPFELAMAVKTFVSSRRDQGRMPLPMRLGLGDAAFYLRVVGAPTDPPVEVAVLHEEITRNADAFKLLNSRYQMTRREYQVLSGLRLGKTNKEIAAEFGLAEGTVGVHVRKLLERFKVPNRTRLVDVIERLIAQRI
jgi:DNA-binding CsgD family transcriptional regulator